MNEKQTAKRAEKTVEKTNALGLSLDAKFAGFVNFDWQEAHKEAFVSWSMDFDFWEVYDREVAKGRRISTQFDLYHSCYVSSAFERDVASHNAGMICTARGISGSVSLSRLLYLLQHPLRDGWGGKKLDVSADKW